MRNIGNTCHQNAWLQQLIMNPRFKEELKKCTISNEAEHLQKSMNLVRMKNFFELSAAERSDEAIKEFSKTWVKYNCQVGRQQDFSESLLNFFDNFDEASNPNVAKDVFEFSIKKFQQSVIGCQERRQQIETNYLYNIIFNVEVEDFDKKIRKRAS